MIQVSQLIRDEVQAIKTVKHKPQQLAAMLGKYTGMELYHRLVEYYAAVCKMEVDAMIAEFDGRLAEESRRCLSQAWNVT